MSTRFRVSDTLLPLWACLCLRWTDLVKSIQLSDVLVSRFGLDLCTLKCLIFIAAFIIQCYGSVLSPLPGGVKTYEDTSSPDDLDQGNLSRALGSVVGIATLRAEGGVGPQLTSHTFGLLKARSCENQNEEDKWLSSDEGTEWVLRTVDHILDGISSDGPECSRVKL